MDKFDTSSVFSSILFFIQTIYLDKELNIMTNHSMNI